MSLSLSFGDIRVRQTDRRTTRTITIAGPHIVAGQLITETAAGIISTTIASHCLHEFRRSTSISIYKSKLAFHLKIRILFYLIKHAYLALYLFFGSLKLCCRVQFFYNAVSETSTSTTEKMPRVHNIINTTNINIIANPVSSDW